MGMLDPFSVQVAWLAPFNPHLDGESTKGKPAQDEESRNRPSQVIYYLVQWAAFPYTDWDQRKIDRSTDDSKNHHVYQYKITGLLSQTAYKIRVLAVGSKGPGAALELGPIKTKIPGKFILECAFFVQRHFH